MYYVMSIIIQRSNCNLHAFYKHTLINSRAQVITRAAVKVKRCGLIGQQKGFVPRLLE